MRHRGTSLRDCPVGRPAEFVTTHAEPSSQHRLAQLGVRRGTTIVPIQRTPGGGVVIAVGELRLALDRASVCAIEVRRSDPTDDAGREPT
ncbi:MAG: FeoA family protein [Dermatophilaceae bacterium]